MEKWRNLVAVLIVSIALVTACKEQNDKSHSVGAEVGNGENYVDEQDKSSTTETGQNIGSSHDSTTVRDEPGKVSNN